MNGTIDQGPPDFYGDAIMPSGQEASRLLAVLLVFENPADLDRICHRLEKNPCIAVDFSISDEDAVHLMHYIRFDVVVTEYHGNTEDPVSLLRMMRGRQIFTPLIYYFRSRDPVAEIEAAKYPRVLFVPHPQQDQDSGNNELYRVICNAVFGRPAFES